MEDGVLGDFMEHDAAGMLRLQAQGLEKVPGNGLSLAVLIGCEPDRVRFFRQFLQFRNDFFLVGRYDIFGFEAVSDIDPHFLLLQIPDVPETRLYDEILSQKLLDGPGFGRRLHDNQIALHILFKFHKLGRKTTLPFGFKSAK